jgi:hypothetical protein
MTVVLRVQRVATVCLSGRNLDRDGAPTKAF